MRLSVQTIIGGYMTHPKDFGGFPDRMNPPKDNTKIVLIMMAVSLVIAYVLIVISTWMVVK